jgi:hypothetical protein
LSLSKNKIKSEHTQSSGGANMGYKLPVSVDTIKPRRGLFSYWLSDECTKQVFDILDGKNASISASFYHKVPVYSVKYLISETNFDRFTRKFCESKEFEEYRLKALKCDGEDLLVQDSYLLVHIKNEYASKAYCLLQRESLKFQTSLYDTKLIDRIKTSDQYDDLVYAAEDEVLTCAEANKIVGCVICQDPVSAPCVESI